MGGTVNPCAKRRDTINASVPLTYVIDATQELVVITGEYSDAEEWQRLLASILTDPRMREGFGFLRDLRAATTPVDAATVVGLMDTVRRFWPLLKPSRAAVLTPREFDPAAFAAHALADGLGLPLRMFTSYEAAMDWLQEGR
jgi:hypothetical protein